MTSKNKRRETGIKIGTYYVSFSDNIINIKNIDPKSIKYVVKSYKNTLIYYTEYITPSSVKPLYIIFNKINGNVEENNERKYRQKLLLIKTKQTLKKY